MKIGLDFDPTTTGDHLMNAAILTVLAVAQAQIAAAIAVQTARLTNLPQYLSLAEQYGVSLPNALELFSMVYTTIMTHDAFMIAQEAVTIFSAAFPAPAMGTMPSLPSVIVLSGGVAASLVAVLLLVGCAASSLAQAGAIAYRQQRTSNDPDRL